jgi:hypothetical protein
LKIQEEKIRISAVDRCVMCGNPVPEGQQVCGLCKHKTELEETIACKYYVPAWGGSKTSNSQPGFCLKYRVFLRGKCVKSCKEQNK